MKNGIISIDTLSNLDILDLKKFYPRNFGLGMTVAVLLHILIIGFYYFLQSVLPAEVNKSGKVIYINMNGQPTINMNTREQIKVSAPAVKPNFGVFIPVPDVDVSKSLVIPTQKELSNSNPAPVLSDKDHLVVVPPNIKITTSANGKLPSPEIFVPFDKAPEVVLSAVPVYPELAKRSEIEGNVVVKILISKDGKPLKAIIVKSDSNIFNQPSIDAAMKFIFIPAIQHKSPVMVWVAIPFKFRLNK